MDLKSALRSLAGLWHRGSRVSPWPTQLSMPDVSPPSTYLVPTDQLSLTLLQACALWLPETFVAAREVAGVGRQEYVGGLEKIRPERCDAWGAVAQGWAASCCCVLQGARSGACAASQRAGA